MTSFDLTASFSPAGDQPKAIDQLVEGFSHHKHQTLLGVTGSGKTFTMANVIKRLNVPTLIISHNKTLAAQLYGEFRMFFPHDRVGYFVSYYDYYRPESYLPKTDTYIEKESDVNPQIERLRLQAATHLMSGPNVVIVATVSCIFGFGSPAEFRKQSVVVRQSGPFPRRELLGSLVHVQYERNDMDLGPGTFRARGDVIDVFPPYADEVIRIELFGDDVERIGRLHPVTGARLGDLDAITIFPAKPFAIDDSSLSRAVASIRTELDARLPELGPLEAHRLRTRTKYDLEMLEEMGYCTGIENYSRHFDGRASGEPPYTMTDYFPDGFLTIVDESHVTLPQLRGMVRGDHSRKKNLIDHGFRLPSAYDNRPLTFEEFMDKTSKVLFVSATPASFELRGSGQIVEQIIRPTGLVDPFVVVHPVEGQVDDLMEEIRRTTAADHRTLVTTLTKRMAEDLTSFLSDAGHRVRYIHAEVDTLERTEIIRDLRLGTFDVLVGINLLREGLDLPEVGLVAILDADKAGYLRTDTALIQTIGRASRNAESRVIMYADKVTEAMDRAIRETERRRDLQTEFNREHGITPATVVKAVGERLGEGDEQRKRRRRARPSELGRADHELEADLEAKMRKAAEELDFERAIELRDRLRKLRGELPMRPRT